MGFLSNLFRKRRCPFSDYLPAHHKAFEHIMTFNVQWSSVYGVNLIDKLTNGDVVYLEYADTPYTNGERIQVYNKNHQQIGWAPFTISEDNSIFENEFLTQITKRIDLKSYVSGHGTVSSNPKYRWCEITVVLQVPYPETDDIVYHASTGYLYHCSNTCNRYATHPIPKSIAEKLHRSPCSRCNKPQQ